MIKYEKIIDGLMNYINDEIIPGLNPMQEIGIRVLLGELYDNKKVFKDMLANNGLIRTFGYIDNDGNVDIERFMTRVKNELQKKGSLEFVVPLYGKFKFVPEDIDTMYNYINK